MIADLDRNLDMSPVFMRAFDRMPHLVNSRIRDDRLDLHIVRAVVVAFVTSVVWCTSLCRLHRDGADRGLIYFIMRALHNRIVCVLVVNWSMMQMLAGIGINGICIAGIGEMVIGVVRMPRGLRVHAGQWIVVDKLSFHHACASTPWPRAAAAAGVPPSRLPLHFFFVPATPPTGGGRAPFLPGMRPFGPRA